jgi:hypothetical protein
MATPKISASDAAYWFVPLARAIPAAVVAIVITFSQGNYSAQFGLVSFGGFAIASGIAVGVGSLRALARGLDRTAFVVQAAVSVVAGLIALFGTGGGVPLLMLVVSSWAALSGFVELYLGLRGRRGSAISRDWVFTGAITALLAVVIVFIPADFVQHYQAPDHTDRFLTSSVVVVGLVGVYAAILTVYLVIAGLSLRWAHTAVVKDETIGS